jgi:hypothetical protein
VQGYPGHRPRRGVSSSTRLGIAPSLERRFFGCPRPPPVDGPHHRAIKENFFKIHLFCEFFKYLCPDPALLPTRKSRVDTVPLPSSSGRSRQGVPVRAIHKAASTNSRLSQPVVCPGFRHLTRKHRLKPSHWSSRKLNRNIPTPMKY